MTIGHEEILAFENYLCSMQARLLILPETEKEQKSYKYTPKKQWCGSALIIWGSKFGSSPDNKITKLFLNHLLKVKWKKIFLNLYLNLKNKLLEVYTFLHKNKMLLIKLCFSLHLIPDPDPRTQMNADLTDPDQHHC